MVPSDDSDDSIKAGADLLLRGWKMLSKACPVCLEPLYEKDGNVVCVRCKRDYIVVDSPSQMPQQKQPSPIPTNSSPPSSDSLASSLSSLNLSSLPPAIAESVNIILSKISDLNSKLKQTTDPKEIVDLSNSISSLVDSLRSLIS
ncbi:MAG: Sjogren's syndrome/scleroderma autoantigen 1 family protein [Candidatus Heimdallarchaeaceae archaeon]